MGRSSCIRLYRAVRPPELNDLDEHNVFRNVEGLEVKYFTRTREEAELYARMAQGQFADGPYTVVEALAPADWLGHLLATSEEVRIEKGIRPVVVATSDLQRLTYRIDSPR